jgi:hypothetical protein
LSKDSHLRRNVLKKVIGAANAEAATNVDGWGIAYRKENTFTVEKSIQRFPTGYSNELENRLIEASEFILHLRSSTGGTGIENTHPILSDDKQWVLVHNGVFQSGFYDNSIYLGYYSRQPEKDNKDNISDSRAFLSDIANSKKNFLSEILNECISKRYGSYSCFLIDPQNRVFYFRNSPSFRFWLKPGEFLLGATNEFIGNLFYSKVWGVFSSQTDLLEFVPEPNILYEIKAKIISPVSKIEENSYGYGWYNDYNKPKKERPVLDKNGCLLVESDFD